jgi:hypothetical protein
MTKKTFQNHNILYPTTSIKAINPPGGTWSAHAKKMFFIIKNT